MAPIKVFLHLYKVNLSLVSFLNYLQNCRCNNIIDETRQFQSLRFIIIKSSSLLVRYFCSITLVDNDRAKETRGFFTIKLSEDESEYATRIILFYTDD